MLISLKAEVIERRSSGGLMTTIIEEVADTVDAKETYLTLLKAKVLLREVSANAPTIDITWPVDKAIDRINEAMELAVKEK